MTQALTSVLYAIHSVISNYGWSMVLFTLLVKLIVLPLDYKSRKSMRRTTALQPEMQRLQKKYANDKEKLNQKMAELYRKEGVSPMSGCLPMIVSMFILWFMFAAMRSVANTELAKQCMELLTTGTQTNESWLWIKNLWMPDSPFNSVIPNQNSLRMIPADVWTRVFMDLSSEQVTALAAYGIEQATLSADSVFAALQTLPIYAQETALWSAMPSINLLITSLPIYANNNGWFVLPVLAAATQFMMTASQPQPAAVDANGTQASTSAFMKYFFPLFSLWICSTSNALFSLYWVVSNLFAWIQSLVLNKVFESMDQKEKTTEKEGSLK